MKSLSEEQKEFIKYKENGHIPPWSLLNGFEINELYQKWLEIVGNSRLNKLEEITNEEVGKVLKDQRELMCLSRVQVAGVIGISPETLKAYENGTRTLPFDIYYKLVQFMKISIGILKIDG